MRLKYIKYFFFFLTLELSRGWWTNVRNGHTFPKGNQRYIGIQK